jgi:hypothetical protein
VQGCEPRDHVGHATHNQDWEAEIGLIGVWHNGNHPQGTNTTGMK